MPVDRSRRFALPGIDELNKDQDEALALPLEGQHLIVGGPGTGKSVIALLRARRLATEGKTYRVLVYNHLLNGSNMHLFGMAKPLVSRTWEKWFRSMWKYIFEVAAPSLESVGSNTYRALDWEAIEIASAIPDGEELPLGEKHFLLVDEGQDMPPQFYATLAAWGVENFYIVADQNQQLEPEKCSSRQDIEDALAIETNETLELKANYRNTRPIAQLAQHFYPADPASPRPELPDQKPAATTPELWVYGAEGQPSISEIVDQILQLSDRFPKKLIGVMTPDNSVREKFLAELMRANPRLDNGKPPIQTFVSGRQEPLDFGQGGVMVINAQSCKGLEFDIAILADIDLHKPKQDVHTLKSRFYVMVARGREQVILLRTGTHCPVVAELLPEDSAILVRKE